MVTFTNCTLNYLRLASTGESRVQRALSDSEPVTQPRENSLGSETVTSVGEGSVLSEIDEEVVRSGIDTLSLETGHELIKIVNSHGTSSDLSDVGHEHINGLGDSGIVSTLLHVEGLDLQGESGEEDGLSDLVGHLSLSGLGDIITESELVAVLVGDAVLVEPLQSIDIRHSHERSLGSLEARVELLDKRAGNGVSQNVVHSSAQNLLNVLEEGLKVEETKLGLNVGVLGQMSSSVRSLGSERLGDTVGVSNGRNDGLQVQLRGLGQVGLLSVVVKSKQGGAALNLGLDHAGRGDFGHSNLVVDSSDASQEAGSHLHDGRESLSSHSQVSVVQQVRGISTLLDLVGDGIVSRRSKANDLVVVNHQLVSSRSSGSLRHFLESTVDGDRGLEGQVLGLEGVGQVTLENTLQVSGTVSQNQESNALLGSQSVDPAKQLDSRTSVSGGVSDLEQLGLVQRLVLGDDNLLGSLQSSSLGSVSISLGSLESLGLLGLLDETVDTLLGLLQGRGRNVLVGALGTLNAGLEDLDLAVGVGVESVGRGLVGSVLGAGGRSLIGTLVAHVDGGSGNGQLFDLFLEISHGVAEC